MVDSTMIIINLSMVLLRYSMKLMAFASIYSQKLCDTVKINQYCDSQRILIYILNK